MDRVGAQGHVTFGGRLTRDARGLPASAMAKKHSGDWRRTDLIVAWASEIARALPTARPGAATTPPGRSLSRLIVHGVAGWAACALTMIALLALGNLGFALVVHAVAAPLLFVAISRHYFGQLGRVNRGRRRSRSWPSRRCSTSWSSREAPSTASSCSTASPARGCRSCSSW